MGCNVVPLCCCWFFWMVGGLGLMRVPLGKTKNRPDPPYKCYPVTLKCGSGLTLKFYFALDTKLKINKKWQWIYYFKDI